MTQQLVAGGDGIVNAWLVQEGARPLSHGISEEEDPAEKERGPEGNLQEPEIRKKFMVGSYVPHHISNGAIDSGWGWIGMLVDGVQKGALLSSLNQGKIWRLDIQQELLLMCHLWNQDLPEEQVAPRFVGPTQDLYLCFIIHGTTTMLGTLPVPFVDFLGCGEMGGMKTPSHSMLPLVVSKPRQGKPGEVCWLTMVLRPDLCARRAGQAVWTKSTQLKNESSLVWDDPQGKPRLWNLSYYFPVMM